MQEPQGISFYNVKSGDTHYCKLEPTIAAYINSSDMGINASRGQDFGWKLGPDWVQKVKEFRRDRQQMQVLASLHGGNKPTTVQILYFIYSEELRAWEEAEDENESPFEDDYRKAVNNADKPAKSDEPAKSDKPKADEPVADPKKS